MWACYLQKALQDLDLFLCLWSKFMKCHPAGCLPVGALLLTNTPCIRNAVCVHPAFAVKLGIMILKWDSVHTNRRRHRCGYILKHIWRFLCKSDGTDKKDEWRRNNEMLHRRWQPSIYFFSRCDGHRHLLLSSQSGHSAWIVRVFLATRLSFTMFFLILCRVDSCSFVFVFMQNKAEPLICICQKSHILIQIPIFAAQEFLLSAFFVEIQCTARHAVFIASLSILKECSADCRYLHNYYTV